MTRQSERKIAEKLLILNDRGVGLLTRLYNIKKALEDFNTKPKWLVEKALEPMFKIALKRFPQMDVKTFEPIHSLKTDIIKSLSLYYETFIDLLDFKDEVNDLFNVMDVLQMQMDVSCNFEVTKYYMELICTYVSLMIFFARIEDRKVIICLFNGAQEMEFGRVHTSYHRLANMTIDYEVPFKKIYEDFTSHTQLLSLAIKSLVPISHSRTMTVDEWKASNKLNLTEHTNPHDLPKLFNVEHISSELLPMHTLERWIFFGVLLIHGSLTNEIYKMFLSALGSSWVLTLFRDEVIHTHQCVLNVFDSVKGYGKRCTDVKECLNRAVQKSVVFHRPMRNFLRIALKDLSLIFRDEPGLLAPKILMVFIGLTSAQDEVHWLLRHMANPPHKKAKQAENLEDRYLPELLFYMEDLRILTGKYSLIIKKYYAQYLANYDAMDVEEKTSNMKFTDEEKKILNSTYESLSAIPLCRLDNGEIDLFGFRLNLFRLQTYFSMQKLTSAGLFGNKPLAQLLDTIQFHSRMVDSIEETVMKASDLSMFFFYRKIFDDQFCKCLEFPSQGRNIIAFPSITEHFKNATHNMCPEEWPHIREISTTLAFNFLEIPSKKIAAIVGELCEQQSAMSRRLWPENNLDLLAAELGRVRKRRNQSRKITIQVEKPPGEESYRKYREDLTDMDKIQMALSELCFAMNYRSHITVDGYKFHPREFLFAELQNQFKISVLKLLMFNPQTNEIARPSKYLWELETYMDAFKTIESYLNIDMKDLFTGVLLQQTQELDCEGKPTVTSLYSNWYSEVLFKHVNRGNIIFSMTEDCFFTLAKESTFYPEHYTNTAELKALSQIIGPLGMQYLSKTLTNLIVTHILELKKLVEMNKDALSVLRLSFEKPETMKEYFRKLNNVDTVLKLITTIGTIVAFRNNVVQSSVREVFADRVPLLYQSIVDFNKTATEKSQKIANSMGSAIGLPSKLDRLLISALEKQKIDQKPDEYLLTCLLLVFVAVSISKLASFEQSCYMPSLEAHGNNIHCISLAIDSVFGALFTLGGKNDVEERMKEFLALVCGRLLYLSEESTKDVNKNGQSVYLLLEQIVNHSSFLTMDLLQKVFPYVLIRDAYRDVFTLSCKVPKVKDIPKLTTDIN